MGIASGEVAAGFTGTPKEYAASVFGRPLLLAAASARMKPLGDMAARITFPEAEWQGFSLDDFHRLSEGVLYIGIALILGFLVERERKNRGPLFGSGALLLLVRPSRK